jgi:hypothetical protein
MAIGTKRVEDYIPVIKFNEGFYTESDFTVASGAVVTLPSTTTIGGSAVVALGDITSTATTGSNFAVTNTGIYTGTGIVFLTANSLTSGTALAIVANGATTGVIQSITSTGTMTTTGSLLTLTANSATTAAGLLRVNANALSSGIGAVITSSATAITGAGRLLRVDHTGATTTSGVLTEIASAANDETVVFRVTASAALASGVLVDLSGAAVTTGTILDLGGLDALTTGTAINVVSDASGTGTRSLVRIVNDNTGATGTTPLYLQQDALISTNFKLLIMLGTIGIYVSDQTSPNGALSAAEGSICLNGSATGQAFWNADGATAWTALA